MKRAATGTTTIEGADTPASKAVAALEAIPLGNDHLSALAAARDSLAQDRAPAVAVTFPPMQADTTADAVAVYTHAVEGFGRATIDRDFAQLHAVALRAMPAVAALVRTASTLVRVDAALAFPIPDTSARAGRIDAFCRDIARQLAEAGDQSAAVIALASTLPALEERISAAGRRHDAHAEEQQRRAYEARKARARTAWLARIEAVLDLRQWFRGKSAALFHYNGVAIPGAKYAEQVLSGNPAQIPIWRVHHAITARKTHESLYQCPAWQREWTPAELKTYRSSIADLKHRLEKITQPAFSHAHAENLTGSKLAAELLTYESDGSGGSHVAPSAVRRCIAAVQRFDKTYTWKGPSYAGFEIDEEFEADLNSEDHARLNSELRDAAERDLAALRRRYEDDSAARAAFEETRNQ